MTESDGNTGLTQSIRWPSKVKQVLDLAPCQGANYWKVIHPWEKTSSDQGEQVMEERFVKRSIHQAGWVYWVTSSSSSSWHWKWLTGMYELQSLWKLEKSSQHMCMTASAITTTSFPYTHLMDSTMATGADCHPCGGRLQRKVSSKCRSGWYFPEETLCNTNKYSTRALVESFRPTFWVFRVLQVVLKLGTKSQGFWNSGTICTQWALVRKV